MTIETLQAWREPISANWRAEVTDLTRSLGDENGPLSEAATGRLRRLARMRLGAGERLQLRRLVRRALGLAQPLPGFRTFRLLLVSNRTLCFFGGDLEAAGVARGLLIDVVETDYDQVRSLALNPKGETSETHFDAVLLLLDSGFFQVDCSFLDAEREAAGFAEVREQFDAIVKGLSHRYRAPVIAGTIAVSPDMQFSSADRIVAGTSLRMVQSINETITDSAQAGRTVLFDLAGLAAQIGTMTFFDPVRFLQAKVPFSLEASPVIADALSALIAAMTGRSARVLVLDLDNTLWGGVVADDGLAGIVLGQGSAEGEAFLQIQQFALDLRSRGVVLVVCSKNLEAMALEPFRSHPDMLLREEHLSLLLANFDDKATNVARAAKMLNLDPSVFVLLDDNPAERERLRAALPAVMVPEVGEDPAHFVRTLVASGYFEHTSLTADDVSRAATYQARAEAKALRETLGDYGAYLKSLDMELTIASADAIGRSRIVQLIQKSNQFNLTATRYSEPDIAAMESDPFCLVWQVRLKDRFADHGMISVVVVRQTETVWTIENWVMSCRVLERGVEAAIISELARLAAAAGVSVLVGTYCPAERNALVKDLYPRHGFDGMATAEDGTELYRLVPSRATFELAPMSLTIATQQSLTPSASVTK